MHPFIYSNVMSTKIRRYFVVMSKAPIRFTPSIFRNKRGPLFAGGLSAFIMSGHLLLPLGTDNSVYQSMALAFVRFGRLPYLGSWDENFPGIIPIHAVAIVLFGNS